MLLFMNSTICIEYEKPECSKCDTSLAVVFLHLGWRLSLPRFDRSTQGSELMATNAKNECEPLKDIELTRQLLFLPLCGRVIT
jgi:hypothetical protein